MKAKLLLVAATVVAIAAIAVMAGCSAGSSASGSASGAMSAASAGNVANKQISQEEAQQMMESESSYVIVDVRTQDEFNTGHIPGAICIPNESISKTQPAELPDLDQLIMVYCRSGNRSKQAAQKLATMDYTNVVEFGGISTRPGEVVAS